MNLKTLLYLTIAFFLGACAQSMETFSRIEGIFKPTTQQTTVQTETTTKNTDPPVSAAKELPSQKTSTPLKAASETSSQPLATIDPLYQDRTSMMGLSSTDIVARFGRPFARRIEGSREVWQYRSGQCVMLVHFRRPDEGGEPRIDHVDLLAAREGRGLWMQAPAGIPQVKDDAACLASHSGVS